MKAIPPRGSLRLRLLVGTLFWIALSIAVAGWGLGRMFREHVAEQFHAELRTHLDQLTANLTLDDKGRPGLALPLSDPRLTRPYSGCYWQVDAIGGPGGLLRSRSLWDHVLAVPQDTPADGEIHQHQIGGPNGERLGIIERSVRIEAPAGSFRTYRLIAAADERLMSEPVARFNGALWLALGVLGGGLVLAALVQVFVGLAPLRALRAGLGMVRSGRTVRLEGSYPAEIMPLVDEFNSVLAQNAAVVERSRTQAGNLAHALKTPLSILANAAQGAGRDDGARELAELVSEQVSCARRQVDYHLARAQAAATRIPGTRTALAPVIAGLLRAMRRIHAERQLVLESAPLPTDLAFGGDEHDLQEMLGNALDNACKWAKHRVLVEAGTDASGLHVSIDDDGPGIPEAQREAVLQRGVRADEQVPGSGLGLAIVDDLARLYGGSVSLHTSPLGGLRVTLTLPGAGQI